MFEERKNLLNNMGDNEKGTHKKSDYKHRAKDTQIHIDRIKAMLVAPATSGKISKK